MLNKPYTLKDFKEDTLETRTELIDSYIMSIKYDLQSSYFKTHIYIPQSFEEFLNSEVLRCSCCEEPFAIDDMVDTETMVGGGVGYQCEGCAETLG